MRYALLAILAIALAVPAQAAPKHFYRDWRWWAGVATIEAATTLDVQSSCRAFRMGYTEQSWPLRGTGSCGKVAAFGFGMAQVSVVFHGLAWHCQQSSFHPFTCYGANDYDGNHPKLWGAFVYGAIPVTQLAIHLPASIHNYGLKPMDSAAILAGK